MTKTEFKNNMRNIKNRQELWNSYICNKLDIEFGNNIYPNIQSHIVFLFKEIINGTDSMSTGMFGHTSLENKEGHEARKMALEMFEYVMIDEKLYKELQC